MRVVTLTLHPAIDRIMELEECRLGEVCLVRRLMNVPSGKGTNTARSLRALLPPRHTVVSATWIGAAEASLYADLLEAEHIQAAQCKREDVATRCNYTLLEAHGRETHLKESMPAPTPKEERAFLDFWKRTLRKGDLVAVCGSAPGGATRQFARKLFEIARERRVLAVFADTNGMMLEVAATVGLDGMKGNTKEIGAWLKLGGAWQIKNRQHRAALAKALTRSSAPKSLLITAGAAGGYLASPAGLFSAKPPKLSSSGHQAATGCGDAATAGWLTAILAGQPSAKALGWAVACGTAKLASADPGGLDGRLARKLIKRTKATAVSM